jgi:hypothetical protein
MREGQQRMTITATRCPINVYLEGPFIGVVTGGYYNVYNAPVHLP